MKRCTGCLVEKNTDEFFYQSRAKNQRHAECKSCYKEHRKQYSAEHYVRFGDAYRLRAKTRRATIKRGLQNNLIEYLSNKACVICGESDIRTLDFDHLDPKQKSFNIAKGIRNGLRWEQILLEINKCRILCANCHRKHTAKQFNWYKAAESE